MKKKSSLSRRRKFYYKSGVNHVLQDHPYFNNSDQEEHEIPSASVKSSEQIPADFETATEENRQPELNGNELTDSLEHNANIPINDDVQPISETKVVQCEEVSTSLSTFQQLKADVWKKQWENFELVNSKETICFVIFYKSEFPSVKLSVSLKNDLLPVIHVHNKPLPHDHDIWDSSPRIIQNIEQLEGFLDTLSRYEVCTGNFDEEFHDITPVCSSITHPKSLESAAFREGDMGASHNDVRYKSTIRSNCCKLLCLKSNMHSIARCKACRIFRGSLRSIKSRRDNMKNSKKSPKLTSTRPLSSMSNTELKQRCQSYKLECKRLKFHIEKLKSKMRTEISVAGEELAEKDSSDIISLVEDCDNEIKQAYPDENSFQRLFWEEQRKFNILRDKRQMKWHPMIIKWCLFLRHKSASTYSAMKEMGFINLPSTRTLYDYSHYIEKGCGFIPETTKQLMKEVDDKKLHEDWQTYVGILFDEIRIKSDLVYNKHTGELVGFLNLGDVGNAILDLERHMQDQNKCTLAKYVLVLFVRGVATNLKFPLAHFATGGITADILYPLIWEALEILEVTVGLKVLFITCDGASPNRRFFKLHHPPVNVNDAIVYCTENPYAFSETRYLHFISDVPHLLKTTRNCFANSNSHKKTRKLWFDTDISWMHIVDLYEECVQGIYNFCPKLTRAHIDLTSYSCMKVKLAAQIFSDTVAHALEQTRGDTVRGTVKFIRMMNKFFDCLNTRNLYEGRNKRNTNLNPYSDINDARLNWLLGEFLTYLEEWGRSVENRPGCFSKQQRAAMMISYQTLEGIRISVKSIVSCTKYMINSGAPFILTEVFNQDILEQHFGHHRGRCGSNTNPTLAEVDNNMIHLRVIGSQAIASASGNTRRRPNEQELDCTPLPKRRRPRI